ncbi:hypothetical protein BrevBR_16140 [Brevundimonas sp. BR2-1]|uniref:hypothetical protein n=1 Tax=Brevundimonas sp. BR2-1 TaxID=3031123 RepID=UPI0030AD4207
MTAFSVESVTPTAAAAGGKAAVSYQAVNDAINSVLFDGRHKLAPVYLDIEGEAEEEIAALLNVPAADCGRVIAAGAASSLKWNAGDPFSWHLGELDAWDELDRPGAPPFTALLAALSLAAERMRADEEYSAQNYYERLFEVLGVTSESRKTSLRANAKSTRPLWLALNFWLQEHDFDFGRPTAKRINDWAYASYALSQALVRDADRKRLHGLFAQFGFAAHETLTDAEMTLYLHEWMGGASPSAWLKRIWNTPDLRPRVAAAACAELEAWEGDNAVQSGPQRRRLSWAASLEVFPRPRLRMFLSAAGEGGGETIGLALSPDAPAAARAAFEDCGDGLWLTPSSSGEVSIIEPVQDIALSPLMLAAFELRSPAGEFAFHRAARSIVPLVKLDTGAFYREVSRVSFLRPHLVLCHEKWTERVTQLLTLNARKGFRCWTPELLPGLPEDWVLFSGVEMLRASASSVGDLQALIPLAEGVALEMAGGLKLSQGIWHTGAPPEITATAAAGPFRLELTDPHGTVGDASETANASCRLTLEARPERDAANFTVTALAGGRARRDTSLSLRSASHPRRLPDASQVRFYRAGDGPAGFLGAGAIADPLRPGLDVLGLHLRGPWPAAIETAAGLGPDQGDLAAGEDEVPAEHTSVYRLDKALGLQETCVLRGYHSWDCQPFNSGDDRDGDMWMRCTTCEYRVLTRNRGQHKKGQLRKGAGKTTTAAKPPGMAPRAGAAAGPDLILDALCYLGAGSWRKLQDLAGSDSRSPLEVQRFCAAAVALGHIDVSLDPRLRAPLSWIVAPPVLAFNGTGQAFLAGFRNTGLVAALDDRLGAAGGKLTRMDQPDAPAALMWGGLTPASARDAVAGLSDPHGRPITVSAGFTAAIASQGPDADALASAMPPIRLESVRDLQRFDPGSGSWRKAPAIDQRGAYRGDYGGRRYVFADENGQQREGSFALVKLMAARAAGLRLHGYNASSRVFQAVLGCEPPGLYQRALVSASGLMPETAGGRLSYRGVAPADAALILSKLYT